MINNSMDGNRNKVSKKKKKAQSPADLVNLVGNRVGKEWAEIEQYAGYGRGFWTLLAGVAVAVALLYQIDSNRPHPTVERVPASDIR